MQCEGRNWLSEYRQGESSVRTNGIEAKRKMPKLSAESQTFSTAVTFLARPFLPPLGPEARAASPGCLRSTCLFALLLSHSFFAMINRIAHQHLPILFLQNGDGQGVKANLAK